MSKTTEITETNTTFYDEGEIQGGRKVLSGHGSKEELLIQIKKLPDTPDDERLRNKTRVYWKITLEYQEIDD